MPAQLNVSIDEVAGARRVRVEGDLDSTSSDQFQLLMQQALEPGADVYLDLVGVEFIDSYGIRGLVNARDLATGAGMRVTVTDVSPCVADLLEVTGLTDTLTGTWSASA